jgi:hypothetical protein
LIRDVAADLDIRVRNVRQIFHTMDPAPFRERDLDPAAEQYIVDWAREVESGQPLRLNMHLEEEEATPTMTTLVRDSVDAYFRGRAQAKRRELRALLRTGWISLAIGFAFVAVAVFVGEYAVAPFLSGAYGNFVLDSVVILAWVALWRPMEIFLYDWWPIRNEAKLYDRLGTIDVQLRSGSGAVA